MTIPAFSEERFPLAVAFGAQGGPERRTEIVRLSNGRETRNGRHRHSTRRFEAGTGVRSLADLAAIVAFFEARRGRLVAFRFRDPLDWRSGPYGAAVTPFDQTIGLGDGTERRFRLVKLYGEGAGAYARPIEKPVAGTVRVAVGGAELAPAAFSPDAAGGLVTLAAAPAPGAEVTAGFEFDVAVRFDTDSIRVGIEAFEGTVFAAASGLTASETEAMLGLGAGTQDVEGILSADAITDGDIEAGRFDGASVETFAVNWQAPEERVRLALADLGAVTREGGRFRAELRGPGSRLDALRGRVYARRCDASLGDARCGVDLTAPGRSVETTVAALGPLGIELADPGGLDPPGFAGGTARVLTGAGAGLLAEIEGLARTAGGRLRLATLERFDAGLAPGDGMRLLAGCDRSFSTCRGRFGNGANFRGFPHLPGADAALAVARHDGLHDGSPLVP